MNAQHSSAGAFRQAAFVQAFAQAASTVAGNCIRLRAYTHTCRCIAPRPLDAIQLKELLRADHPDHAAVMAKGDALSPSASALIRHYLDAILPAKAILTPEQQKMIRAYMENGGHGLHMPR